VYSLVFDDVKRLMSEFSGVVAAVPSPYNQPPATLGGSAACRDWIFGGTSCSSVPPAPDPRSRHEHDRVHSKQNCRQRGPGPFMIAARRPDGQSAPAGQTPMGPSFPSCDNDEGGGGGGT
jgi:hypothetical protein